MKKVLFILIIIALALTVFACTNKEGENICNADYDITLSLDNDVIKGQQTVNISNVYADGLDGVVFNLYANAYSENTTDKAYSGKLEKYGGITLSKVTVDNQQITNYSISQNGQLLKVPVAAMKLKDKVSIGMEYTVNIPHSNLRLGVVNDSYNLANFYPQLAVFNDGAFREDRFTTIGDPMLSEVANYQVTLTVNKDLVVASSAKAVTESTKNELKTYMFKGEKIRDFAMAANKNFKTVKANYDDIAVTYYYTSDKNSAATLECAVSAVKTFSEAFGKYEYPVFSIVQTPFFCDGMEFSSLIYISDTSKDVLNTVIHETAHQWWYGMVGSDSINESYLDEGLTSFVSAYYYLLNDDIDSYNSMMKETVDSYMLYEKLQKMRKNNNVLVMNKSIYDYTSYQYDMLAYNKGSMMFMSLYEVMGKDKFNKSLKTYFENNKYGIADVKNLCEAFSKVGKTEYAGFINGWIGDNVIATFA